MLLYEAEFIEDVDQEKRVFEDVMYYFEDKDRQELLLKEMQSWELTPFRHWSGVKGQRGGCDCIHFVLKVLEAVGVRIPRVPRYDKDWNLHNVEELLYDGIIKYLNVEEVGKDAVPLRGDLVLYWYGKVRSHIGIYYDGRVYQSITDMGVENRRWDDPMWYKRLGTIMRLRDVV